MNLSDKFREELEKEILRLHTEFRIFKFIADMIGDDMVFMVFFHDETPFQRIYFNRRRWKRKNNRGISKYNLLAYETTGAETKRQFAREFVATDGACLAEEREEVFLPVEFAVHIQVPQPADAS